MKASMPDGLYERDALAWAERQAGLLRRLAAGERVNAEVDWANVIEEVGEAGLSELRAVESLLRQALLQLLKLHGWPESLAAGHWRGEIVGFLGEAASRFMPSMRQRVDVERLYGLARRQALAMPGDPGPIGALPERCPWRLEQLLDEAAEPATLAAMLDDPAG